MEVIRRGDLMVVFGVAVESCWFSIHARAAHRVEKFLLTGLQVPARCLRGEAGRSPDLEAAIAPGWSPHRT